MSGGGGKGGSKTTETTIPEWVRAPADRNLQRAEAVQQLEYMPYFGAQVAALNENQTNAMQNNANAASAFGLLAPTDAMADMPTPTTYANGMKGYSSMPIYDQAMKELTASNPENMDAYDALFGGRTTFGLTGGGGSTSNSRFSGSASPSAPPVKMNPVAGIPQAQYEKAMTDRYATTRVGTGKNDYGYTGQGTQSRAGVKATPPAPKVIRASSGSGNKPKGAVGSVNPRKNYGVTGKRVTGGR
tara:strand:+ start:278 stop:1009 length:732 start_codon:yes stop_codon:yes gene_type:complete